MKTHTRRFKVSATFPIDKDDRWLVRDGQGAVVEAWRVVRVFNEEGNRYFLAEIITGDDL